MKKGSILLIVIFIVAALILVGVATVIGIKNIKTNTDNTEKSQEMQSVGNQSINTNAFTSGASEPKVMSAKLQIIQYDHKDSSEKIVKTIEIKANDKVNLEEYDGNNIEVLEVNTEGIKISREAVRYKVANQKSTEYKENVIENVKYGEEIPINIDSHSLDPMVPQAQARYEYSIKIMK